ncbi:hypothetical protein PACTADRAFT_51417 [Pachysolen tannophilus NRRL Y-2460]|uniref:Ataxin-10 homolog n=1 Tax=Pachysolen tannophilus NRRL Y-2460 TaxID=669874 RepID=A0A1E4TPG1_PACTA|nr:hypothetical protein PACTADRAFT_51417 [Pachysolen tannophilus NRRL Y-2460]
MDRAECLSYLSETLMIFESNPPVTEEFAYQQILSKLSLILSITNTDERSRELLSSSISVWVKLSQLLQFAVEIFQKYGGSEDPVFPYKVRIVRGIVLISRNLVVGIKDNGDEQHQQLENHHDLVQQLAIFNMEILDSKKEENDANLIEASVKSVHACLQFLANITSCSTAVNVEDSEVLKLRRFEYSFEKVIPLITMITKFEFFFNINDDDKDTSCDDYNDKDLKYHKKYIIYSISKGVISTFLVYLNNLFNSSEFLYNFLNSKEVIPFIQRVIRLIPYSSENEDKDLEEDQILVVALFTKISMHESCIKLWQRISQDFELSIIFLKTAQLILTNKENFENYQLTSCLAWVLQVYDDLSKRVIDILTSSSSSSSSSSSLEPLNLQIFYILDILTNLGNFNHARIFLNHYGYLEKFLNFLKNLDENIKTKKTLKEQESISTNQTQTIDIKFPRCKSLLIEILTLLVFENFQNQEQMRKLHGLEVILNNCNIDYNEPFIKERSIMCLKYLLLNNQENQNFISKLEAQKPSAFGEAALEEAGYEIELVNGKVGLKKSNKASKLIGPPSDPADKTDQKGP